MGDARRPARLTRSAVTRPSEREAGWVPASAHATSDARLITRAQQGDTAAFEVLLLRHRSLALRLAARVLGRSASPADAEDAVQDAFLSAWRRLPEFRGEASFSRWMCRIVTNRCLNLARSQRPTMPLDGVLDGVGEPAAASGQSPERRAEAGAALLALRAALAALTPPQRACWLLAELHGLSYQEIAQVVRSTPQAVRGRIFRARRDLAAAMRAWR